MLLFSQHEQNMLSYDGKLLQNIINELKTALYFSSKDYFY